MGGVGANFVAFFFFNGGFFFFLRPFSGSKLLEHFFYRTWKSLFFFRCGGVFSLNLLFSFLEELPSNHSYVVNVVSVVSRAMISFIMKFQFGFGMNRIGVHDAST